MPNRLGKHLKLVTLAVCLSTGAGLACCTAGLPSEAPSAGSTPAGAVSASKPDAPQQRRGRFRRPQPGVYKAYVTPHWFDGDSRFWYCNLLRGGEKEFILVDAVQGTRQPAFDHERLAAGLKRASGQEIDAKRLPFSEIEFVDEGKAVQFEVEEKSWRCDLGTYECVAVAEPAAKEHSRLDPSGPEVLQWAVTTPPEPDPSPLDSEMDPFAGNPAQSPDPQAPQAGGRQGVGRGRNQRPDQDQNREAEMEPGARVRGRRSPDGRWMALVKDFNVYLRSESTGAEEPLSHDGVTNNGYGRLEWSPDSTCLVAWRIEPGDRKLVYLIESSPPGGGRAILHERPYAQAGDRFTHYEVNVFDIAGRRQIKPEVDRYEHEYETPRLHWSRDGGHFAWEQEDRGHQRLRVIDVDARTGAVRNLIDERSKTFIWTAHTEMLGLPLVNWLKQSDEFIYVSERDGWRHLYLVDEKAGGIENQITKGPWVVRGIDRIDEDKRQVWFRASGMNPDQDPYFVHYYRINFDGTGLVALTQANGNHTVEYSPDGRFLIDTYSRVDRAPVHELRRGADGKLVCRFEQADISELKEHGWQPPEVFVAKGRDGKTDIWGIINLPRPLDPSRKYPILESIYAGPQGAFVPKSFFGSLRTNALTELGFVVVQIDGMGTAFRSKAFHDVCWHNLKDAGFPDRILWIKAAAAKYPFLDLTRVGIFGTSAGGQSAAAAVLYHPDFYKVAVANSGCHDNRLDKASWNEQWMGYMPPDKIWVPGPDNWYSQCSNIDNAAKLRGKLLLIVGEMDDNVPPESTFRFVDALIKARKDFDLVVVPGANHGAASPVTQRRLQDFFVHNLLGIEPPDRNAAGAGS
jgi:dipeptidyl aminopeptidase/acylaminoacyl peptidase